MPIPIYQCRESNPVTPVATAVTEWRGTVSSNWVIAGNWTNGVPVAGARAIFNSGSVAVTIALGYTPVQLQSLEVCAGYTGQMGVSGTPIKILAGKVIIEKQLGRAYLDIAAPVVHIWDTAGGADAVVLSGSHTGGYEDLFLYASRGEISISTGTNVRNIYAIPRAGRSVTLTVAANVGDTESSIPAWLCLLRAHPGAAIVHSNNCTITELPGGNITTTGAAAQCKTMRISNQGTANDQGDDGIDTLLTVYNGHYTLADNEYAVVEVDDVAMYGGTLDLRTGANAAAISGDIDYYGGRVMVDDGVAIDVT